MKSHIIIITLICGLHFSYINCMQKFFDKAINFLTISEEEETRLKQIADLEKKITIIRLNYLKPQEEKDIATIPYFEKLVEITNQNDEKHNDYVLKLTNLKKLKNSSLDKIQEVTQLEEKEQKLKNKQIKNDLNIETLSATITATAKNSELSEFTRLDKLAGLLQQRAIFYKNNLALYQSNYDEDIRRINQLRLQTIAIAPNETTKQAILRQLSN